MENMIRTGRLKPGTKAPEEILEAESLYVFGDPKKGKVFVSAHENPLGKTATLVETSSLDLDKAPMSNEELKEIIIDLKMKVLKLDIPENMCPYIMHGKDRPGDCMERDCRPCTEAFFENMKAEIRSRVERM